MSNTVQILLRRGTTSQWTSAGTVLAQGEPGFDTVLKILKIGDGVTQWNSLANIVGITGGTGISVNLVGATYSISSTVAGLSFGLDAPIGLGYQAGLSSGSNAVALGNAAGQNNQDVQSIAIGYQAGQNQQKINTVAIGVLAGNSYQNSYSVAIGNGAGSINQGQSSVAIGDISGATGQGNASVAIGPGSGNNGQGDYSIAIGAGAGFTLQAANTIIFNASGTNLVGVSGQTGSFYVAPIRSLNSGGSGGLVYDAATNEITYNPLAGQPLGVSGSTGIGVTLIGTTYTISYTAGHTGGTGISVSFDGTTYTVSSNLAVSSGSVLFSSDGLGTSGTTGFQYSTNGITLGKINIQGAPESSTVSIGNQAGNTGQASDAIAIGTSAGASGQRLSSVAIGRFAGSIVQEPDSVAIGHGAGYYNQQQYSVAIGVSSGQNFQGLSALAIGAFAGNTGQGDYSVALGAGAGYSGQGQYSVALGAGAGSSGQAANTIVLNASGSTLSGAGPTGCFYVDPIRQTVDPGTGYLVYDAVSKEITCEVASPTSGVSFCNANTIVDANPGGIYATGYSYNEIPIAGVNVSSIVQVSSVTSGITGLYEAHSRGRFLAVEPLSGKIRIWTEQPGLGSTYLGYSWNILSF